MERTGLSRAEIYNWRKIYMTEGISGILNRHIGRPRSDLEDQIVAYVGALPDDADRKADEIGSPSTIRNSTKIQRSRLSMRSKYPL